MEEFLEILRHDKVRELIEETSRFYYTSPATTVDLGLPIAVTGLFLVGEILRGTKAILNQLDLFSSGRNDPDLHQPRLFSHQEDGGAEQIVEFLLLYLEDLI